MYITWKFFISKKIHVLLGKMKTIFRWFWLEVWRGLTYYTNGFFDRHALRSIWSAVLVFAKHGCTFYTFQVVSACACLRAMSSSLSHPSALYSIIVDRTSRPSVPPRIYIYCFYGLYPPGAYRKWIYRPVDYIISFCNHRSIRLDGWPPYTGWISKFGAQFIANICFIY